MALESQLEKHWTIWSWVSVSSPDLFLGFKAWSINCLINLDKFCHLKIIMLLTTHSQIYCVFSYMPAVFLPPAGPRSSITMNPQLASGLLSHSFLMALAHLKIGRATDCALQEDSLLSEPPGRPYNHLLSPHLWVQSLQRLLPASVEGRRKCENKYMTIYWYMNMMAQTVKNLPAVQETWVISLGQEDPLLKRMATHSNILSWRIPQTEEPLAYNPWGHEELDMTDWHFYYSCPCEFPKALCIKSN